MFVESFFHEAKEEYLKDMFNFGSRKMFDNYMKNLETSYYDSVKLPKSPYVDTVTGN